MYLMNDNTANIWLSGTQAMVTADKSKENWDPDFVNPAKSGNGNILWTKQNFIYMRLFNCANMTGEANVQMYIVKSDAILFPKENWMPLYTDCALKNQPIRIKGDTFGVNAHPFVLSGLYDWGGYTLIGHFGELLDPLPEIISEESFKRGIWTFRDVTMESEMPFIINYCVPKALLQEKRLCTRTECKQLFQVEVADSMIRELDVAETEDSVMFNGTGMRQVTETVMLYFNLKPGAAVPEHMEITTQKEERRNMSGKWSDLTFARKYHADAWLREYDLVRSKQIDCGVLHKEYRGEAYGGKKDWIERQPQISLKIPIARFDDESSREKNEERYRTPHIEVVKNEVNVDYPSVLILKEKEASLGTDTESLEVQAEKRELRAGSGCFLTAAVWYGTTSTEDSDAFVVTFYHAFKQYKRVPEHWTPLLTPTGQRACLKYTSAHPNTRVFPMIDNEIQYWWWDNVPKEGYLIARITDTSETYNPFPKDTILSEEWFDKQEQWAFIEIDQG